VTAARSTPNSGPNEHAERSTTETAAWQFFLLPSLAPLTNGGHHERDVVGRAVRPCCCHRQRGHCPGRRRYAARHCRLSLASDRATEERRCQRGGSGCLHAHLLRTGERDAEGAALMLKGVPSALREALSVGHGGEQRGRKWPLHMGEEAQQWRQQQQWRQKALDQRTVDAPATQAACRTARNRGIAIHTNTPCFTLQLEGDREGAELKPRGCGVSVTKRHRGTNFTNFLACFGAC